MPNGSIEGAARLYQGSKAGRGSFLRLATRAVEAGIGAAAIHQLEPAQKALAKATTREQRTDGYTVSKNGELKQRTPSTQTRTAQAEALLGLPEPLTEIIAVATVLGIAGIAIVLRRRGERGSSYIRQFEREAREDWRRRQARAR